MRNSRHHHHHHHHYGARDDYAHRAGDPGPGPNRHRLRRNVRAGKVAGVCAGIADYFDWNVKWLRIGAVLGAVFFFPMPIIAYMAAAFMMKSNDASVSPFYESQEEERFWRTFSVKPKATFAELKHRFRALDARIGDMEKTVTSSEYGLRKEFRDLEHGV